MPKFEKGNPGRPKGTPNKATASIKAALLEAFDQRGGVPALLEWANDNPTEFYKLVGRLVPTEVTGKDGEPLTPSETHYVILGGQKVAF